jgi:phosphinothricin acetyltransferase
MTPEDTLDVLSLYRDGIESGRATFETKTPTWDQWDVSHHSFARELP